jgi:cation:H+ antiporter
MVDILLSIFLVGLFYALGRSADWAVVHLRAIAEKLGIKIYFLGFILGAFTSLPELMVGINATIKNVPSVSLGNLFGGIFVAFGLILGVSLILNRRIHTDGLMSNFIPIMVLMVLPIIFGLDGTLSVFDGAVMVLGYLGLLIYLYKRNQHVELPEFSMFSKKGILRHVFFVVCAVLLVLLFSDLAIRTTLVLIADYHISAFIVGLLVYSIGTNLPEIIITFRSWRKHIKELSVGHLTGSAMANIFIMGILAFLNPLHIAVNTSFFFLALVLAVLLVLVAVFYKTGRTLTRREGIILVCVYVLFVVTQLLFRTI